MAARYDPGIDVAHATESLTALLPLINTTGEDSVGWMEPKVWADMTRTLDRMGVLDRPIDPGDVYTMRILEQVYGVDGRRPPGHAPKAAGTAAARVGAASGLSEGL